jgi:CHAT domain-containing protein
LRKLYFGHNQSNPDIAGGAASALEVLAQRHSDPRISAVALWVRGMAAQLRGEMEASVDWLREASAEFARLGDMHSSASVQVSLLTALAILGRYADAIACGESARTFFIHDGDYLSAGKVEQNLGGLYFRRDRYADAEQLLRSARDRFGRAGDDRQLAQIDNNIAIALTMQHRFAEAATLYDRALGRAAAGGMEITQAEIEDDIGQLALHQGRYQRALEYLERARRRFEILGMPHAAACAQSQLADAYLELNLVPEAITAYEGAIEVFQSLGMRVERAAAVSSCGRAYALKGDADYGRKLLTEAQRLYLTEDNEVGQATVRLAEAQMLYEQRRFHEAVTAAALADAPLATAGTWGRLLRARWLRGDALREMRVMRPAQRLLRDTLRDAEIQGVPQMIFRCQTSLGLIAAADGDSAAAMDYFEHAIDVAERMRSPLPAEEFRTAFVADKLSPYTELVRLSLSDPAGARVAQALEYAERSRSRTLVEVLRGDLSVRVKPRDAADNVIVQRVLSLREELNWLYSHLNQIDRDKTLSRERQADVQAHIRRRERDVQEALRQLDQNAQANEPARQHVSTAHDLQRALGSSTAMVEYLMLDDEVLAFVITDEQVEVVRHLADKREVQSALSQLQFQLHSLRGGSTRVRAHLRQLSQRAHHYLHVLHTLLLAPVEERIGTRRLVIAPFEFLHYVPFHALFDGSTYLIERREVSYVPSGSVLQECLAMPRRPFEQALFVAVPDDDIPRVDDEVRALSNLFQGSITLSGAEATVAAVTSKIPDADLVHLACHGKFRPDNPLFSALRLSDGWLTVREAYDLELDGRLVTLSACETGVSAVAPGDELIGLLRGFFSAGAPSLVVSLWTVDDDSTRELMLDMYARLRAGDGPAAALRAAQRSALEKYEHPFFWAPFAVFGRW